MDGELDSMPYDKNDRYRFPILEVAQRINGACRGTSDPLADLELKDLSDWLYWRIVDSVGWEPTQAQHPNRELFDKFVWDLCFVAVTIAREELQQRMVAAKKEIRSGN